jgi:hypothetical protein
MCILHDIETQNNQFIIYLREYETWSFVSFLKNENHFTFKEEKVIENKKDEILI